MSEIDLTVPARRLTHFAALRMLERAIAEAERQGEPQCVTLVNVDGTIIAQLRMDGARLNALAISEVKARTAASTRAASGPDTGDAVVALATGGRQTGLVGGLPIFCDGEHVGGIGVSSGPDEVDVACAQAAFALSERLSWTAR